MISTWTLLAGPVSAILLMIIVRNPKQSGDMMKRLENKTAIITGGAGDIGKTAAKCFVEEGAKVFLVDQNEEALKKVADSIPGRNVSFAVADVTQPDQVKDYVKKAVDTLGGIDIFLNNAGIEGSVKPITDYPVEDFDRVIAVNVRGVWLGLKYVIPEMAQRGGGSIIITSSVAGVGGAPNLSAYVASKHAVIGIMRTAALEAAPLNIRVNTVNPSPVEGRMMGSIEDGFAPGAGDAVKEMMRSRIPLNRYADPGDVVAMMLFLAGDEGRFLTGGVYMVDGGQTAN
jgi:NAD(P)-dependent dehydrogenase (short-subunit alcohol dehydrogenase family)